MSYYGSPDLPIADWGDPIHKWLEMIGLTNWEINFYTSVIMYQYDSISINQKYYLDQAQEKIDDHLSLKGIELPAFQKQIEDRIKEEKRVKDGIATRFKERVIATKIMKISGTPDPKIWSKEWLIVGVEQDQDFQCECNLPEEKPREEKPKFKIERYLGDVVYCCASCKKRIGGIKPATGVIGFVKFLAHKKINSPLPVVTKNWMINEN